MLAGPFPGTGWIWGPCVDPGGEYAPPSQAIVPGVQCQSDDPPKCRPLGKDPTGEHAPKPGAGAPGGLPELGSRWNGIKDRAGSRWKGLVGWAGSRWSRVPGTTRGTRPVPAKRGCLPDSEAGSRWKVVGASAGSRWRGLGGPTGARWRGVPRATWGARPVPAEGGRPPDSCGTRPDEKVITFPSRSVSGVRGLTRAGG